MLTLYIADVERDVGMKKLSQEEAAKVLEDMKVKIEIPKAAVTQWKRNTALDMAIEALKHSEVPNSSDTISRQDAIKFFTELWECIGTIGDREEWEDVCVTTVNEIKSAQPEPQWIPVSERLPERDKEVLVTRDYDGREDHNKSCRYVETASCYGEEDDISWHSYSDEYKMTPRAHRVIARMPLPIPYRPPKN